MPPKATRSTKDEVRAEYGCKRITKKVRDKVLQRLRSDVEVYSDWANGNVYAFLIEDEHGDVVDSCHGFIGDVDECLSEGIAEAEAGERARRKRRATRLKDLIRNHVPLHLRQRELSAA